jgi:ketosteroid isomerase-like protein
VFLLSVLALFACAPHHLAPDSATNPSDSVAVADALHSFLTAFENLDWETFRSSFADDACVFFPSATTPDVFCGRSAVEARFRIEFASIREAASSGPPYMQLHPDSLKIQVLDRGTALVTFELHNIIRIARRSLVFAKRQRAWRIIHLHASNVPWPDEHKQ